MVQLVNGFSCHNSADVALARRGINPAASKPSGAAPTAPATAAGKPPVPAPDAGRVGRGQLVNLIA